MCESYRLAICQMNVVNNKRKNIEKAVQMIETAADNGAQMVVLPEMFNCPYVNNKFKEYAESMEDGFSSPTVEAISKVSDQYGLYVIAGSIPELKMGNLYNTSFIFDKKGKIIAEHRKMHLFDIDIPGGITFKESETLTPGNRITTVETEFCKIGIAICYDVRFPELMRLMTMADVKLIVIPAAFNMTTGPAHWEALMRVRAIDNQVYIAAASPARNEKASYVAYGNSMVVDPWGDILSRAGKDEEIVYADISISRVEKIRNELPLLSHRRTDIYDLRAHNNL
jgi:omega-amidase